LEEHCAPQVILSIYIQNIPFGIYTKEKGILCKRVTKIVEILERCHTVVYSCCCYFFCRMSQLVVCSSHRHAALQEPYVSSAAWLKRCVLEGFGVGAPWVSTERVAVCYPYCSAPTAAILKTMFFYSSEGSYCTANSFFRRSFMLM